MRKTLFAAGEYYHIYNRGTDKRDVFLCKEDMERFFLCMNEFNVLEPMGSLFELQYRKPLGGLASKGQLVEFVAYCLNQNHYHFILKQIEEKGIEKFMQRLGTGYTMYFNEKYERNGGLFQGPYKAKHVSTDEYLLHLSVYINLNHEAHQLGGLASKLSMSSKEEYFGIETTNFCKKDIVLKRFSSNTDYMVFSRNTLKDIIKRKEDEKDLREVLLEA